MSFEDFLKMEQEEIDDLINQVRLKFGLKSMESADVAILYIGITRCLSEKVPGIEIDKSKLN